MPTIQQLEAEPWWGREIVTDELDWLGDQLCRRTGRPRDAFGTKGNAAHLSGGHRSQEWIRNSDYCTNTSYTVQSGLSADQLRHIAAFDWTPGNWGTAGNRRLMVRHTTNLFNAARRGELTGMRQIFGTLNGTSAIGLNVLTNTMTYPDDSHLDHLHGTFDRLHMRDMGLMRRIADIITGEEMNAVEWNTGWMAQRVLLEDADQIVIPPNAELGASGASAPNLLKRRLVAIEAKLAALTIPAPAPVDPTVIAVAVKAALLDPLVLASIAVAVADEDHRRSES